MAAPQIIDAHVMLGTEPPLALEAEDLLRRMDACGIERAVARPLGWERIIHDDVESIGEVRACNSRRDTVSDEADALVADARRGGSQGGS